MKHGWMVGLALWATLASAAGADDVGELRVESSQSGALVFVDRKMAGTAPIDIKVPAGRHLVRVSKDENFFPFEDTIDVRPQEVVSVNASLRRSALSWFHEGVDDMKQGRLPDARAAFQQSLDSPGKRHPANYFYLGLLDEQAGQTATAAQEFTQFIGYRDDSAAAHYHLGLMREQGGQIGPAATQYKLALFRLNPQYETWVHSAPPATTQAQTSLQGQNDAEHRVQLAYVLEQKGTLDGARALYRALAEQEANRIGVDLNAPPLDPTALPPPDAAPLPAPGQP